MYFTEGRDPFEGTNLQFFSFQRFPTSQRPLFNCNLILYPLDVVSQSVFICALLLNNRSPTRVSNDKSPTKAFAGRKPDLKFLRGIGAAVYALITEEQQRKNLDEMSFKNRQLD